MQKKVAFLAFAGLTLLSLIVILSYSNMDLELLEEIDLSRVDNGDDVSRLLRKLKGKYQRRCLRMFSHDLCDNDNYNNNNADALFRTKFNDESKFINQIIARIE